MPRPPVKRSRFAQRNQPQRVANSSVSGTVAHLNQVLAGKPTGKRSANSDDSDDLVVIAHGSRNRRGVPRKEIFASGGLGEGDEQNAHKRRGNKKQKLDTPQSSRHDVESRNEVRRDAHTQSHHSPLTTSPASNASRPPTRAKGVSSTPSAVQSQRHATGPQSTPAMEPSVLGTFKRRPRQPSILRAIETDTFSDLDVDDSFADLGPPDESTPVRTNLIDFATKQRAEKASQLDSINRTLSPQHGTSSSVSSVSSSGTIRAQASNKQASKPRSESPVLPMARSGSKVRRDQPQLDSDTLAPPQSSSSPLPSPKSTIRYQPLSNESDRPSPKRVPLHSSTSNARLPLKKLRQKQSTGPAHLSTEQLENLLPRRRRKLRQPPYNVARDFDIPEDSDDESQRIRQDTASDEEELSFQVTNKAGRRQTASRKAQSTGRGRGRLRLESHGKTRQKGQSVRKKVDQTALQKLSTTITTPLHSNGRATTAKSSQKPEKGGLTYSSRRRDTYADKENQPFDTLDESVSPAESVEQSPSVLRESHELKQAAKKFAEIDDWDMDFEDVTVDTGSSSPGR